jgi:hypothetical protein
MLYSIQLNHIKKYYAILNNIKLYYMLLCYISWYSIILNYCILFILNYIFFIFIILYYIIYIFILYHVILYYIIVYNIILYYINMCSARQFGLFPKKFIQANAKPNRFSCNILNCGFAHWWHAIVQRCHPASQPVVRRLQQATSMTNKAELCAPL